MVTPRVLLLSTLGILSIAFVGVATNSLASRGAGRKALVSSGRALTPTGDSIGVGCFPANSVLSPDGKFMVVTDTGYREALSVIDLESNTVASSESFDGRANGKKDELYYGLAFGLDENNQPVLYVSRGGQGEVLEYRLSPDGKLTRLPTSLQIPKESQLGPVAGIATDLSTGTVAVAINGAGAKAPHNGEVAFFSSRGDLLKVVDVPGYPLDLVIRDGLTFAACERDGVVAVLSPSGVKSTIAVGKNPTKLRQTNEGIWVTNSGSDSISLIDTSSLSVKRTIQLRPHGFEQRPISTPLDLTFSRDGKTIYVALADLNAVGVVDSGSGELKGLIPTGWYPTSVQLSPNGSALFVTSAKGTRAINPNKENEGKRGHYCLSIIEGSVSKIDLYKVDRELTELTKLALDNLAPSPVERFINPGIQHVIYIVKENRTYDQVFGDIKTGNGDPSLVLFGENVTPNQHALAKRFVLLDNFYDCAEVSADGWNWSTSGMVNEFTARNVPNNYSRRRKGYDYEGSNGDVIPDKDGLTDVAEAPGGYIWDLAVQHHVSLRNYGFFVSDTNAAGATEGTQALSNVSNKRAMESSTDTSFRKYDLAFTDSDIWTKIKVRTEGQLTAFGAHGSPSRYSEWKHEFDDYVAHKSLPALSLVRLPRDHTAGTSAGDWSPRAMVADNDYAVGEIVDAVSHSPYWKSTAIFVIEDDSQDGQDHVDCHRSTCLVISPYIAPQSHDSGFYNTDSVLRTIEVLLGLPPMNGYDANATTFHFGRKAENAAPFEAILPDRAIAGEINLPTAYRAADSKRLVSRYQESPEADLPLNDILWHAIKGNQPMPKPIGSAFADRD